MKASARQKAWRYETLLANLPGPGFRRPQWGVRGSLFAAFAVIAGMAIVISAGAGMVLGHLGGSMLDLSGRDRVSSRMSWP